VELKKQIRSLGRDVRGKEDEEVVVVVVVVAVVVSAPSC